VFLRSKLLLNSSKKLSIALNFFTATLPCVTDIPVSLDPEEVICRGQASVPTLFCPGAIHNSSKFFGISAFGSLFVLRCIEALPAVQARSDALRGKIHFRGHDFCFYHIFETNFSGTRKFGGKQKKFGGNCPRMPPPPWPRACCCGGIQPSVMFKAIAGGKNSDFRW